MTTASELLKPYDSRLMRCYPINTRINHVADDEECSAPVELTQSQARTHLTNRRGLSRAWPAGLQVLDTL